MKRVSSFWNRRENLVMTVAVRLIGILSKNSEKREFNQLLSDKADILSLLMKLEKSRVQKGSLLSWNGQVPRAKVLVLVNKAEISALRGLKTGLTDGDSITVVPVSHGG